jgi:large subunit ribosomal protein L30
MAEKKTVKKLRITQIRSAIGETERHKATIRALGLHRLHETVEHEDSPSLRGMIYLVAKLVRVEESE